MRDSLCVALGLCCAPVSLMLKAICLTAWNRPALLEASLASIARLRHLEHWSLFVQLEPSDRLP